MADTCSTAPATQLDLAAAGALAPLLDAGRAVALAADGALVIDVRGEQTRHRDGLVDGAVVTDRYDLDPVVRTAGGRPVVVVCGSVRGSGPVAAELLRRGLGQVWHVDGGFAAWRLAGGPVLPPATPVTAKDVIDPAAPLVDVDTLARLLPPGQDAPAEGLRILDVRWALDRPDGRADHRAGHIPTSGYVDLDTELARPGAPAAEGRHPLPTREALQRSARRWGLHDDDVVVVADAGPGTSAARAWWLLRHAGFARVHVLDGGLAAWQAAGLPIATGEHLPDEGDVTLAELDALPVLDADAAAALPRTGLLLDARAGERYRGEVEPVDPRAGHIPGAVSAPTSLNVGADGRFLAVDALRERFGDLGVRADREVGVYCGSGVTAAHEVLALTVAGFRASLYPGSWSAWSNDLARPVATGAAPDAHPATVR